MPERGIFLPDIPGSPAVRTLSQLLAGAVAAGSLAAQTPPAAPIQRLAAIHSAVQRLSTAHPDSIWPGFRPETIPVLYVLPGQGILLLGWPVAGLPEGFAAVPGTAGAGWQAAALRTAASTGTTLAGRNAAQVFVFPDANDALLLGTTVHEAFHVFERSRQRDDRKFGSGENSFLVSSYPVFAAANEAGWALEGRLLARALAAGSRSELRRRAQEFTAARETRHRSLGSDYADFEVMADLNEGLAEYALVRCLALAAGDAGAPWRADAGREVARHRARLDSVTADVRQSLRLRFYVTGPAMGMILDRLAGPAWKADLVRRDLTLQEELAEAAGYRDRERALLGTAARAVDTAALGRVARAAVTRLRAIRRAQVDSVLARSGVTVVLRADSLPGRRFGLCGIDPQNLLQVDSAVLLHTRWVKPCGPGLTAEFTTAAVQDRAEGTFTAVMGDADSVRVSGGGNPLTLREGEALAQSDVRIESPGMTLQAGRAVLVRRGMVLEVVPLTGR
jgi:hypothetical protein